MNGKPFLRKYHFVYKTVNLINGKYYIGKHSTDNLDDKYLGSGSAILNAIKKYGKGNFRREVIAMCDSFESAAIKEREIVTDDIVNDRYSYNAKTGGIGGRMIEETVKKIASKLRGQKRTKEQRKTLSLAHLGKPIPIEVVEKRAATLRARYANGEISRERTKERVAKQSESMKKRYADGHTPWNKGKKMPPLTEERKKQLSEAAKSKGIKINYSWVGKKRPPRTKEHREKLSQAWHSEVRLKQIRSSEHKEKMRAAAIKRGARPPSSKGRKHSAETRRKITESTRFSKRLETFYAA